MRNLPRTQVIRWAMMASLFFITATEGWSQTDRPATPAGSAPSETPQTSRFSFRRFLGGHRSPAASHGIPRTTDNQVRQVQDTPQVPSAVPPSEAAPGLPGAEASDLSQQVQDPVQAPAPTPPAEVEPGLPGSNMSDLNLPASERAFGGGEPTESAVEAEEAEETADEDTRGLLMKALGMPADSEWHLFGWIQNSFTGNTNGFGDGTNFGVNPNWKANQWMGNQYYFVIENPIEQDDTINWGFRMDNLFGHDWQFTYSQGFANGAFPNGWFAGYDIPQLYGEVHLPFLTEGGIDVKAGKFYTIAGYEVVPAIARPLLSVPYMFNYGQPFTHIGVLTTTHVSKQLNLYNGAINGWDRFINDRYVWGYIGGLSWTSEDERTSFAFTAVWGPNQYPSFLPNGNPIYPTGYVQIPSLAGLNNPGYARNDRTLFTSVLTHKWTDKLTQVMESDQGWERSIPGLGAPIVDGAPINGTPRQDTWYSFGNWFLYNFNDKLTGVWRSEVFWDTQGARTGKLVGDRYYEQTLGMIYRPYSWLWIRPEARYDWSQYHPAYSANTRKEQFTIAFDAIFLF